jgi:hypothetical protein
MPGKFRTRTSHSDIELVGATDTRDVVVTYVTTAPSGVTFPVRVADSQYSAAQVDALASQYSDAIENLMGEPNIAAIYYEQDVNAAGNLVDTLVFVVTSDNGELTKEVREPLIVLILGNIRPVLDPAIAELNAVQNL